MAAVSMCTLKFYLYCKENKKDPPWAWRVRPGHRVLGCALVGSAVAAEGSVHSALGGLGFTLCKNKTSPPTSPHPR